ncbi:hydantoinase/oxoprolinase family protein [Rhizobium leguminosarum]|uniref:hydantoinase/oxoprolinase family protein n=1 Tax=Rhizobium leguminosarum TaxID=384 RepID=UPI001442070F|nr:hydantoinase/oxoprolinase family protein [Rhizobium leguminosarum]NKL53429.1 ROK family protein [Rhizobium leguminosarum bv. viciae]
MTTKIGIDTGGTHTDVVLVDREREIFHTLKVPTTPNNLSDGILNGVEKILARAGLPFEEVGHFVYGTTYVTNIIVEQKNVDVGLITTQGFRDILAIGRATRKENIYDINWRPQDPIVPRRHRLTIRERINARGEVEVPIDDDSVRNAFSNLMGAGIRSVAVCLLHSYLNPVHEQRVMQLADQEFPDLSVSISSEIVREFREYERSSTTAINAYVMRSMRDHLDDLAGALARRGIPGQPYIMRGNGGIMSFNRGKEVPVAITHSGPVAGIVGARLLASRAGFDNIVTFDMGGTSSDIALLAAGDSGVTTRSKLAGYPVLLPVIDLVTIGAGGGSIAQVDTGGRLLVGPRSASSVPGPMCYDQGGTEVTITDANLYTGRLNADYFLAGARKINVDRSVQGLSDIGGQVGLTTTEAALGIIDIAESHMTNAIKLVSVQRGLDPRDFTLVAFGGAGPLHGAALADALGMRSVLIPPAPGNVSASGLLCAEVRQDAVRTVVRPLRSLSAEFLRETVADLLTEVSKKLRGDGVTEDEQEAVLSADMRYLGQSHDISIPVGADGFDEAGVDVLVKRFIEQHQQLFGYTIADREVELVNLRVSAFGSSPGLPWPEHTAATSPATPAGTRLVTHRSVNKPAEWPIYRFETLGVGSAISGPAIVEYPGSTLVVPPGWEARYDVLMNAVLTK